MKSSFLTLNLQDLWKGAAVAFLVVVTGSLATIFEAGALPTVPELLSILTVAGKATIAYLLKNLFTNSNDELLKKDVQ
jgi:hypothetical protein